VPARRDELERQHHGTNSLPRLDERLSRAEAERITILGGIFFMRYAISALAALALLLVGAGQSTASIFQLSSPGDLSGSDTTAIYTGSDGDIVSSPYSLAAGTNTLTFTATTGVQFQRVDQGISWSGDFPAGTKLLWSLDPDANTGSPMSIGFASGVSEVGLSVQQDHLANTTFTATAFSGTTAELTITVTVPGSGGLGFIGFKDTVDSSITSILISSVDSVDPSFNNDFAMGPVTFGNPGPPPGTPEPSALAIAGVSTLGLMLYGYRRRTRIVE